MTKLYYSHAVAYHQANMTISATRFCFTIPKKSLGHSILELETAKKLLDMYNIPYTFDYVSSDWVDMRIDDKYYHLAKKYVFKPEFLHR